MKGLLKLGIVTALQSLLPILMWHVIGLTFSDNGFLNTFTLTLPFQYVYILLHSLIVEGTLKYIKKSNKGIDEGYCAVLTSVLIYLFIMGFVYCNLDSLFSIMNIKRDLSNIFMFGLYMFDLDLLVNGVCKCRQYNHDDAGSFWITILYYLLRLGLIVIVRFLSSSDNMALWVLTIGLTGYAFYLCRDIFSIKRWRFNVFHGLRYQSVDLVYTCGMFFIYVFGLSKIIASESFLFAYNMMCVCTDTQWDALCAIDTYVSANLRVIVDLYFHLVFSIVVFYFYRVYA